MTNPQGPAGAAAQAAAQAGQNGGQLAAFRRHLAGRYQRITDKVSKTVGEFSGHEQVARAEALATVNRQRLIGTPKYRTMEKALLGRLNRHDLAPAPGVGGVGELTPELAHHLMGSEANGRSPFVRNTNPMVLAFTAAKSEAMSRLNGDAEIGDDWLDTLLDVDAKALQLAAFIETQAGEKKNEWMRQLKGGQLIQLDATEMRNISGRVVAALGGKIFDLKDKIFREVTFSYDDTLGGGDPNACDDENQARLDAAQAELDRLVALAVGLKPHYRGYGAVISAVSEHVQKLIDEQGWQAYAETHLKHGNVDYLIDGVDFVLSGIAAGARELPFPGSGAVSAAVILGIGKITGLLHKAARNARIAEEKTKLAPGGVRSEKALRGIYLAAMNQDKSIMARRVLQIQRENLEALWGVVGIGLAEIPVPLVGSTIKTFCLGITVGYYQARVANLEESLKAVEPGMGERVVELVRGYFVEPGVDAVKDVVRNQFREQCAELGAKIWEAAGKRLDAVLAFFREKFGDLGVIAKDALKEGLATFAANLAAKLCADLIAKIATTAIAPAISGGDLRTIIDRMTNVKRDVDLALATV